MYFSIFGLNFDLTVNGKITPLQKKDLIIINLGKKTNTMSIQRPEIGPILFTDELNPDDKLFLGDDEGITLALQEISIVTGHVLTKVKEDKNKLIYEIL